MSERVEAAAQEAFLKDDMGGHIRGRWTFETIPEVGRENYRDLVKATLAAADKTDHDNGIIRVDTRDEATVEKVARVLWKRRALGTVHPNYKWVNLTHELRRDLLVDAAAVLKALEAS